MPSKDTKNSYVNPSLGKGMHPLTTSPELILQQLQELTEEVRRLSKALEPLPSILVLGEEVLIEFKRLNQGK